MCPLVRTPNSCCINKAIQHLSFDPSLQDSAWHRAQARPKPYHTADRDKCSRKTERGEVVCDAAVLDVLDNLGVSLDPTSKTVATRPKPLPKRELSPVLEHLAHKSLYIPGKHSKRPTSCAEYLKRNPGANRVRMLAEIAACLQYLHARKVIHGSIRPESLYVDDEGYPLLSYSPESSPPVRAHPDPYSAPELYGNTGRSRPTIQSDIYSFGSIVHWMCTGKPPYHTEPVQLPVSLRNSARTLRSLALNLAPSSNDQLDSKKLLAELTDYTLKNLVAQCRSTSPASRPLMLSIVLQLQQILVRHVLPTLPLPPSSDPMTSSLSTYIPRSRLQGTETTSAESRPSTSHNRALVLSPRPSPIPSSSTLPRAHEPRAPNQPPKQEMYHHEEYRSDHRQASQPTSYLDPTIRYERVPQEWSHSQQQQHMHRRAVEDLTSFGSNFASSVPPTPRYDHNLHSQRDGAPKLAFYPPESPISPHTPRWDAPPYANNYPATAGLQPPLSGTWPPQGGANIHRNRTL